MSHIFISYSRKDIDFASKIVKALAKNNLDTWVDWKSIPKGEDWEQEIYRGIEAASVFLFLISPDSAASEMCNKEIVHAVKNGKRILPIVLRDTDLKIIHPEISKYNWIFCRDSQDDFNQAVEETCNTIHKDYEWLKFHTELQLKALKWEQRKDQSCLLWGKELREAEKQIATLEEKDPNPTDLQRRYVLESRKRERKTMISVFALGAMLLLTIVLALTGRLNRLIYQPVDTEGYWVTIIAGEFQMGSENNSNNEMPVHTVNVNEFQIGKHEVTNNQYNQCARAGVCTGSVVTVKLDHPVVDVSWYGAETFCEWMGGRLPTEAEWEKAASWDEKANTKVIFPWGNSIDCSLANYSWCVGDTTKVGSYESGKSFFGIYDMAGNIWEWVSSLYMPYPYNVTDGREDLTASGNRVLRGGSWYLTEYDARSTVRSYLAPSATDDGIGFRCARDMP